MMLAFCPLCLSKGRKTVLKCFQINLLEATRMCADPKCPYPLGLAYTDTFIQHNFMDMIKDDGIKLGVASLQEPVPSQPLYEMNMTKMESVKDAKLPSTVQSLMPQENENIFELLDMTESDGVSNENVEDMDFNSVAEFESLFESLVEEIGVHKSQETLPCPENGLLIASDSNMNTRLPTDTDVGLSTRLSVGSDLKLNTGLPTDSDIRLNNGVSVNSNLTMNTGLLIESDVRKLNTKLSPCNKSKTLNTGSSKDSYASGAEGKMVKDADMKVQLKPLFADIEEKKDNTLAVTESCAKYAETSSYSEVSAYKCYVSKHIGSTSAGQLLLNRSQDPAAMTLQALDMPQDSVGLETVATAACDDPRTADGEMVISVQSDTKGRVEINSSCLMTCDSTSAAKSFRALNSEISYPSINGCNILTENRADVISAAAGTPKVTVYAVRHKGDCSCSNIRDQNAVSLSSDLLNVGETCCLTDADEVSEKNVSDGIAEFGTPVSIACTEKEVLDHSYSKVRDENESAVTDRQLATENTVPMTVDIHPLSEPDTGNSAVDVLSVTLNDIQVAENVTVLSCDDVNVPSSTELKEKMVRGLNLETDLSTAKNMFPKVNNADMSQQNLMTHSGTEVTVTDSDKANVSVVPKMLEKLTSEGNSYPFETNCILNIAAETADLKSDNICTAKYTDTTSFHTVILEMLPATTRARDVVTSSGNNMGKGYPQFPIVSSGLQQKETDNGTHLQKPELNSQSRAISVGMNINSMLELDSHQYDCSTCVTNEDGLVTCQRSYEAEVKNGLVGDSKNHAPQTVQIENSDFCVVTHREDELCLDSDMLGQEVMSATHVKSCISPTYPVQVQNLNSVQPLSSDSAAAVGQKGAKHHMTAPKTDQDKTNDICTSLPALFSDPHAVKLCSTQQRKLNTKEANILKISSCLKSRIAFPGSNRDKFSGFTFEKPVPEVNLRPLSKKKKHLKTHRLRKGRKIHSEQNKLLMTMTSNPLPGPLKCNLSSITSSNGVTLLGNSGSVTVEKTDVLDHMYARNESDNGDMDWLQQLLV